MGIQSTDSRYTIGDVITTILDIVGYSGDKTKFSEEFVALCYKQAIHDYLASLPKETQKGFIQRLKAETHEDLDKIILYLSNGEYKQPFFEAVALASRNMLQEYIDKIKPHLSEIQINSLYVFLEGLKEFGKYYLLSA